MAAEDNVFSVAVYFTAVGVASRGFLKDKRRQNTRLEYTFNGEREISC